MQVIGLCRFSYPALGGFQVEHESIEDRIAYLYAPKRLEERFALFETVALPGLKAQTDPDFELLIVVGDQIPLNALARLQGLVEDMPQARIIAQPPRPQREVMKEILNGARHDPAAACLQFRFDDDDAVAVDFIARLRQAAVDSAGLVGRHKSVAFDWNKGLMAEFGTQGVNVAPTNRAFFVAALGMHVRGGCPLTIMNFGHERIPRFMPSVSYPEPLMYLRGLNGFNDSRQKNVRPIPLEPASDEEIALLQERFAIDVKAVQAAFAAHGVRGKT